MLRLWPEEIHIGLFSRHCWVQLRRGVAPQAVRLDAQPAQPLLHVLETILSDPAIGIPKGARIAITVSDAVAAIIALPWQDGLRGADELNRYAEVCLDKAGYAVGSEWLLRSEFRHFGASGLGYGLRREWLGSVELLCTQRGLRLTRVLPASAAAYCMARRPRPGQRSVMLLCEVERSSALVFDHIGLLGYDVESSTAATQSGAPRLLRRIRTFYDQPAELNHWSVMPETEGGQANPMAHELHGFNVCVLERHHLR